MPEEVDGIWWHCPLIITNIEYGHCLDINYDLEGMFMSDEVEKSRRAPISREKESTRSAWLVPIIRFQSPRMDRPGHKGPRSRLEQHRHKCPI